MFELEFRLLTSVTKKNRASSVFFGNHNSIYIKLF